MGYRNKSSNRPESSNVDAAYSYDKVSWVYIAPVAGIQKTIMNAALNNLLDRTISPQK